MSLPPNFNSSKPNKSKVQWILKSTYGEEMGPYATEEILQLISAGNLQGDEKIRKFPHGKWIQISKQAEFYDSLLKVLEDSVKSDPQAKKRFGATQSTPSYEQKDDTTQSGQKTQLVSQETVVTQTTRKTPPAVTTPSVVLPPVMIDLPKPPPHKPIDENARKRIVVGAMAVVVFAVLAIVVIFVGPSGVGEEKPHLIAPRLMQFDSIAQKEFADLFAKAGAAYLEDTYEGYQQSQNLLVKIIEGLPKPVPENIKARGLLCLVYKELWPYVAQDSQDLETVRVLAKTTMQRDPTKTDGSYCEVMLLMVSGKYNDAFGVLTKVLNQAGLSGTTTGAILNTLKAEIYSGKHELQDMDNAVAFAKASATQFPEWVKPQFNLGQYYAKTKKSSEAVQAFRETLKRNPKHKGAMIELGIIQFNDFHQVDQAFNQLMTAVESHQKVENVNMARAYLTLAEIYLEKVEPKKALESARLSFDLNPGDPRAREIIARLGGKGKIPQKASQASEIIYLGDQYLRNGEFLAAQAEYKTAFDLDNGNGAAAMKAAKCLWQLNSGEEAIRWLSKATEADPKLVSAFVLQADYYSQRYNFAAAIKTLNQVAQSFPNNYEILRGYGLVEYRRNNPKQALAYLERSIKIYENDVETLVLLASVNSALKADREALLNATAAIKLDPTSVEAKVVYVKAAAQLNGIDSATHYLQTGLIDKYPSTLEYRMALGDLYKEREKYKEAMEVYQMVTEKDPKNKKAFLSLGEAMHAQNLGDKALKAYLTAAIIDPSDAEGVFRTGVLYLEAAKYKEAIMQFTRALQINPYYPKLNYFIGKALFLNGQFESALQAAMAERKVNPSLADSYILAAEVYTAAKQYSKCAEEYQLALKLRPQGAELYVKMARCYRQGGNSDIAENMLNLAANQESGNPEIYKEQGAIYQSKGDTVSAIKAYNKYLVLSPNAPDRYEIEAEIMKLSNGKR